MNLTLCDELVGTKDWGFLVRGFYRSIRLSDTQYEKMPDDLHANWVQLEFETEVML